MKACSQCTQKAEWRYKDGWGALACAEWFAGTCEGQPRDVAPPSSVVDLCPEGRRLGEDEQYNHWVQTRLREVWLRERSKWTIMLPTEPGVYWFQEDGSSRGILGEVRVTHGPLTVLWTNIDREEATLRARWRGPLRPSNGGR